MAKPNAGRHPDGAADASSAETRGARDSELAILARELWRWLSGAALPLWWARGADHVNGGFHEVLGQDGVARALPRRCRVQPRQIHAFSLAARHGWRGPAKAAAEHGLPYVLDRYRRPDGLFRASITPEGRPRDDRAFLYDQAFVLLGLYGAHDLDPRPDLLEAATQLLGYVRRDFGHPAGGFREAGAAPFQSNAQMHLFEACIAWGGAVGGPFTQAADEIGALCLEQLIDPVRGVIDEFYDAGWRPTGGPGSPDAARRIEPGHQFEWAWLLSQWKGLDNTEIRRVAERLFANGEASIARYSNVGSDGGAHRAMGVAPAAVCARGEVTDPLARLWPQTERLRTAISLVDEGEVGSDGYRRATLEAGTAVLAYVDTPLAGLWRDKLTPDGAFVEEPAPASSLYHLVGAIAALKERVLDPPPPR